MNVNEHLTTVLEVLRNALKERGLRLQEELPPFPGYEKEWAIEDNEGWSYGSLGLPFGGSYKCRMVDPKSLPFDAKETIDWVQSEIVRQLAQGQESVS
jgi:hypothetical protein